jgi:ATP:ADP antiporter, AAA family
MFSRLFESLWGKFESKDERLKFIRLAVIFGFTIGVYWILNPTKDVVFLHTVGLPYFPLAKWFSIAVIIPALIIYGKLVDAFPRHKTFYVLCSFYAVTALVFAYFIMHPQYGVANPQLDKFRMLGWLWYAFVESFGSLMVVLFWSFASDISTPEEAKRGFSVLALGAQVGGVLGPLLLHDKALTWGPGVMTCIGAGGIVGIAALMYYFMLVTPAKELGGYHSKEIETASYRKPKTGFLEGLKLIFAQPYLLGIVAVVTLYEVTATVIEFHAKTMGQLAFPLIHDYQAFSFKLALYANGIALLSLLLGAGAIGRSLGLLKTLLLLPILIGCGFAAIFFNPTLWTVVSIMVVVKGLNYALNQPAKEQLYIPTSRNSKYKAKAWIDTFGSRTAKGAGSAIHMLRPMLQLAFIGVSSLICLGLIAVWVIAALYVGNAHAGALKEDKVLC